MGKPDLRVRSPRISIVVCTYNRADLLADALRTLCEQNLDPSEYEIVVVDNNSGDDTRAVVRELHCRHSHVSYCFEPRQGLSHARNRGWREARGQYIGYFDDDSKAPGHWLQVANRVCQVHAPDVFGGPYYPFYTTPPPAWFPADYGSMTLGSQARYLESGEYLHGTNIFFRRSVLQQLNGFDPSFGMRDGLQSYGEETALLKQAQERVVGLKVYYDPNLYVFHLVAAYKMSLWWWVKEHFSRGRDNYLIFQANDHTFATKQLLRFAVRAVFDLGRNIIWRGLRRDTNVYPHYRTYLVKRGFGPIRRLGKAWVGLQLLRQGQNERQM